MLIFLFQWNWSSRWPDIDVIRSWRRPSLVPQQDANLQRVKKGDMKASIHRMEIDRIRFVLSSYLRSRLQKVSGFSHVALQAILSFSGCCSFVLCQIEKFFPHVLEKEKCRQAGEPSLLSPEEFAFAKEWEQWNLTGAVCSHMYRYCKSYNTQVLQQHGGLPESCGAEADATQPSDCGYAQSWWKFSLSLFYSGSIAVTEQPHCNSFVFLCIPSSWALSGLLCVPAGQRVAGEHPGWAWNGWSKVKFIPLKRAVSRH